jgi:hypothetical protein
VKRRVCEKIAQNVSQAILGHLQNGKKCPKKSGYFCSFFKKTGQSKKNRSIGQSGHPVRDRNFDIANEQAKQERKK